MAKLVVCDGSLAYRRTQLSLLTLLICGYRGIFTPVYCCAGKKKSSVLLSASGIYEVSMNICSVKPLNITFKSI